MNPHVDIVRDVQTFRSLEDEFRPFLVECETANAFLTWEWLTTWLDVFGTTCRLLVVVVRDNQGRLVASGPLRIALRRRRGIRVRQLEFIGTGEAVKPDGLDLLIRRGYRTAVAGTLATTLMAHRKEWDALVLTDLAADSPTLAVLDNRARRAALPHRATEDRVCPYIQLPQRWSELEARLRKGCKRHLKRGTRRLFDELGATFELLADPTPEDVAAAMAGLARLHQDRMENADRGGNFRKPDYYTFHLALAQQLRQTGHFIIAFLRLGDERIAVRYGFVYGRTYYAYQSGFDRRYERHSPSTVLLSCLVLSLHRCRVRGVQLSSRRSTAQVRMDVVGPAHAALRCVGWTRGCWLWLNAIARTNGTDSRSDGGMSVLGRL